MLISYSIFEFLLHSLKLQNVYNLNIMESKINLIIPSELKHSIRKIRYVKDTVSGIDSIRSAFRR